ncbi:hypothetical protein E2I00_005550 [Balaenoptera physalus]|uniref:60S ribosomal protein L26 n=1 Tax=Balaenoptera physalus TaxID=9770 RepID=A0A643AT53_BALPH|nr:hypothetical protein E2I00_005550 [Balaenoptera physalus]
MNLNPLVISDQSKHHKRHFSAPSHIRRKIVVLFFQRAETEVRPSIHARQEGR